MREIVGPGWTMQLEEDADGDCAELKRALGIDPAFLIGILTTVRAGYRIELIGVRWFPHWPREAAMWFRCEIQDPPERVWLNLIRGRAWYGTARAFAEITWDRGTRRTRLDEIEDIANFDAVRPVYGGLAQLFRAVGKRGPRSLDPSTTAAWFVTAEKAEELYADREKRGTPMSWPDVAVYFGVKHRTLTSWRTRRRSVLGLPAKN